MRDAFPIVAQGSLGGCGGLFDLFLVDKVCSKIQDKKMKKDKQLDAEKVPLLFTAKERDRLAQEREVLEAEKKRARHLMEKVNRLMDETEEEVKDGRKD